MKRSHKVASLSDELATLGDMADAIRLMVDALLVEGVGRASDVERAPRVLSAMAALLAARIKLAMRVVAGLVDPAVLYGPHNSADSVDASETSDVLLREWSDRELARRCREELERVAKKSRKT